MTILLLNFQPEVDTFAMELPSRLHQEVVLKSELIAQTFASCSVHLRNQGNIESSGMQVAPLGPDANSSNLRKRK